MSDVDDLFWFDRLVEYRAAVHVVVSPPANMGLPK
jgi:hypothetical protein